MKIKSFVILSLLGMVSIYAQNTLDITVKDSLSNEPLIGVTAVLPSLNQGTISDEAGKIHMENIPNGIYKLRLSYIGYATMERSLSFGWDGSRTDLFPFAPNRGDGRDYTSVNKKHQNH